MSESTAPTLDPAKRKSKTFGRQLSKSFEKSFQKGKEAMKRGLLTPRGARAQQKPTAEAPEYKAQVASAVPNIPKTSVPAQDPVCGQFKIAFNTGPVHFLCVWLLGSSCDLVFYFHAIIQCPARLWLFAADAQGQ